MDDFRIYKGVLTDTQVNTLYQGRLGLYTASFADCPDTSACATGSKHCNSTGDAVCCGAGQYLRDGVDGICQSCGTMTYSADGAASSCASCAVGTWAGTGAASCVTCPGTCATGIKRCVDANTSVCCGGANGQQYFREGTDAQCQTCPGGLYGDGSGTGCVAQCPPGQYMAGGACKLCPAGTFRATPGALALADCLACPQYSYTVGAGSTACNTCAANL